MARLWRSGLEWQGFEVVAEAGVVNERWQDFLDGLRRIVVDLGHVLEENLHTAVVPLLPSDP